MHEVAVLIIWFALNIAGMMVTMFLPHIVADSSKSGNTRDQLGQVRSAEGMAEERVAMVRMGKAA